MGAGEFRAPHSFAEKQCDRDLVIGEIQRWELALDRNEKSHDHYFALVHQAWLNLPEQYAMEFPNETSLRKFALIKTGYCKTHKMVTINNAEATKQAAFMQSLEEYSICEVTGNVVTVWTADSQKYRAMGKKLFQKSKDDVLTFLSQFIGSDVAALKQVQADCLRRGDTSMNSPVVIHARRSLNKKQIVELFHRDNGACCICGGKITTSDKWEDVDRSQIIDEHETPLALGGTNEMSNRGLAHLICAKGKTKHDIGNIAKAKRIEAKHIGAKRPKGEIKSRGFGQWKPNTKYVEHFE
jgi:5-methylcytosine-specific restriction endonuclease McrA